MGAILDFFGTILAWAFITMCILGLIGGMWQVLALSITPEWHYNQSYEEYLRKEKRYTKIAGYIILIMIITFVIIVKWG